MKRNTYITRIIVLMMAFTLILTGCDNLTIPTPPTTPTTPTTPTDPTTPTTPTDPTNPTIVLPATIKPVLGHGYDITSHFAYSPDIKPAVLDLDKLLQAQRVQEDPNLRYGEFETISGKDINEYMRGITAKVSHSANASLLKLVSFSGEIGANFSTERTKKAEYAFTTSTSRIVTGAYHIADKSGLDDFFAQGFNNDLNSTMSPDKLIEKYGTHVMLGAVLGARADYHLSVVKKEQNNITNLGAYAEARAEVTYKGVTAGKGSAAEVDARYEQYFYTGTREVKTRVLGGKSQYGQSINDKQDYDKWIDSISGNEIWIDYYPKSLVPLSDLVTDKSRSDAIAQAIENHCKSKEINVSPIEVGPTSYSEKVGSGNNFRIKNGGEKNWLITPSPSFSIVGLKSAGYTKFVFTLKFDAKNEYFLVNAGSRLYASFWNGSDTTKPELRYNEKFWTPALSSWESKEFIHEVTLDNFDNQLTILWTTSPNGDFSVGSRSITIEAKK